VRGLNRSNLRQRDLAIEDFSQSIKLDSNRYTSYEMPGFEYMMQGKNASAISDENDALRLKPDDVGALLDRAGAYMQSNDLANAAVDFTSVIALKPDYADAYLRRARAEELLGKKNESDQDIQKALKIDPTLSEGRQNNCLSIAPSPRLAKDKGHAATQSASGWLVMPLQWLEKTDGYEPSHTAKP
jgi:tetratricopeptide (TPR) repeat protein